MFDRQTGLLKEEYEEGYKYRDKPKRTCATARLKKFLVMD